MDSIPWNAILGTIGAMVIFIGIGWLLRDVKDDVD